MDASVSGEEHDTVEIAGVLYHVVSARLKRIHTERQLLLFSVSL